MKITKSILTLCLAFITFGAFAQNSNVNVNKSSIHWVGKKIGGQHEGDIHVKSGSFMIKKDVIVSGSFTIDMNSLTCTDLEDEGYNGKLVGHLKSDDFFGVETFPTAQFEVTSATKFKNGTASVTGDLTIKGKTESITFDITSKDNVYSASLEVDRSKFDVKYGSSSFFDSLGDKVIDDIFTLDINLVVM